MSETVIIVSNAIHGKLHNVSPKVKSIVADLLSYSVEDAKFVNSFKTNSWDGRGSFFTNSTSSFPAGFVNLVQHELTRLGYKVSCVKKDLPKPLGEENPIVDKFGNDDPRYEYQIRSLRQIEKHGRGILQIATGGGKSKIAKLIVARYKRPTLFLTTRGVLMHQMKKGFEEAGVKVGIVGDGIWSPIKGVNVGMVQTFISKLEEPNVNSIMKNLIENQVIAEEAALECGIKFSGKLTRDQLTKIAQAKCSEKNISRMKTIKLLEMFEVVIGEEAHEAGGNSYYNILQHCKNAHIRVALTATPFMKSDSADNMRLMAAFGSILIKVSEKTLIDNGILAKPYFKFVECKPHEKLRKTSPWQRAYQLGIVENPNLIIDVVTDAVKASRLGLPVMTLVMRKKHGDILKKIMEKAGLVVEYIQGEDNQSLREEALRKLGKGEINVLIGTTILDVGVDVPAVGLVQLAGGGKAEVSLRQRIGRGLRAKSLGPNVCFIADYSPLVNSYLIDHTKARRAIIEGTDGFKENILKRGEDFDWNMFKK